MQDFDKKERYLLFFLPLLLTFVFGIWGHTYTDQGFINGFSWRILQGQVPYQDFIYPRPPLSIVLDACLKFLSPDFLEIFLERFRYYVQVLICVFLAVSKFNLEKSKRFFLILICYFLTLDSFPPMAWYTVDGIFFAVLALTFWDPELKDLKWTLFFALCSALTKQSFYPIPLLFCLYALFHWKKVRALDLVIGFLPFIALVLFLIVTGTGSEFFSQTSGVSKLSDLWHAGFRVYLTVTTFKYIAFILLAFALFKKRPAWGLGLICLVAAYDYVKFASLNVTGLTTHPIKDWPRAIFVFNMAWVLWHFRDRDFFLKFSALTIAWTSSLSWGHQTPSLFMTGVVLPFTFVLLEKVPSLVTVKNMKLVLGLVLVLYAFQNLNRYRQGKIWNSTHHMGSLDPRFNLIFTSRETFEVYQEIQRLWRSDPGAIFLPSFSDASYFVKERPELPLNWASDIEIRGKAPWVLSVLNSCRHKVYLYEKEFDREQDKILATFISGREKRNADIFSLYCGGD